MQKRQHVALAMLQNRNLTGATGTGAQTSKRNCFDFTILESAAENIIFKWKDNIIVVKWKLRWLL